MALCLTRTLKESVILSIGEELVEVRVTQLEKGRVVLAFQAGKQVKIWRNEVYEKIHGGPLAIHQHRNARRNSKGDEAES